MLCTVNICSPSGNVPMHERNLLFWVSALYQHSWKYRCNPCMDLSLGRTDSKAGTEKGSLVLKRKCTFFSNTKLQTVSPKPMNLLKSICLFLFTWVCQPPFYSKNIKVSLEHSSLKNKVAETETSAMFDHAPMFKQVWELY